MGFHYSIEKPPIQHLFDPVLHLLRKNGVWMLGMGLKGLFGLLEPSMCMVLEIEPRAVFVVGMHSTHMVG